MTKISWCEKTWNPVCGCTKCSPGCLNCYAERMAYRQYCMADARCKKNRSQRNLVTAMAYGKAINKNTRKWTGEIGTNRWVLNDPLHWRKPRRIFVVSMGDLWHPKVPFEFIYKAIAVAMLCSQHTFLFLTKREDRMLECFGGLYSAKSNSTEANMWDNARKWLQSACKPELREYVGIIMAYPQPKPNIHLGVSISTQAEADEKIPILLQIPAAVRWLSLEPLLESVDLKWNIVYPSQRCSAHIRNESPPRGLDWVVIGAESKGSHAGRECKLEWVRDVVSQCDAAGVPVHVKQLHIDGRLVKDIARFPKDLQRRELPDE